MTNFEEISAKVEGKNINPKTLLATDYMNHFNEVIMLFEMIPDMPELLDEVKNWQPKSYIQHFEESSFANKDLAIEAYAHVPANYKRAFEFAVSEMNKIVAIAIIHIEQILDDKEQLIAYAKKTFDDLRVLIEATSSVINGTVVAQTQSTVDTIIDG